MAILLKKEKPQMRVKAFEDVLSSSSILGDGIDVLKMPDSHLCCNKCKGFSFECWVYLDTHRIELGCLKCGDATRLLLPLDIDLSVFGKAGRFTCFKHGDKGFIIIKNNNVLCVGCESCRTQILLKLKSDSLIVA